MTPFVLNTATILFVYILSALFAGLVSVLTPDAKRIPIRSRTLCRILTFPVCLIPSRGRGSSKKKSRKHALTCPELVLASCNQLLLATTVVLHLIPPIPCDAIRNPILISRALHAPEILLETYNQRIPLLAFLALTCIELALLFLLPMPSILRDREKRRRLGVWAAVFAGLVILFLASLTCQTI